MIDARVLVVEDDSLVAMMVEDMLADIGCGAVTVAGTVAEALARVEAGGFDFALLDINVGGEPVFPVAQALRGKGIAFAFASGYGAMGLPEDFRAAPTVAKPFRHDDLEAAIVAGVRQNPS